MALLFDSRFVAQDSVGNPYNGATLTIYLANTTTLAPVYTTSALSTPLTNPVVANSLGIFPQIFAAEGVNFDLLLKTSGGVTLKTYDDVPSLGPEVSTFARDFGTGGRVQFDGSAGVIRLRAGPASPDDVGGSLLIEGQAGTQLDNLELDSAVTEITGKLRTKGGANLELGSDVDLTVLGDKYYGDLVVTPSAVFTAVAQVDIALPAGYDFVEIQVIDIVGAISLVYLRTSFDSGATYKAAIGDYTDTRITANGSSVASDENTLGDKICVLAQPAVAGLRGSVKLEVITTSTASMGTQINFMGNATSELVYGTGHTKNTYGRVTHVRLFPNTATFSGRYRVVAKKGW